LWPVIVQTKQNKSISYVFSGPEHQSWKKRRTQRSILPVPDANGLIVGAGQDPRQLMVEEHRPNVVEMAIKRKLAPSLLIGPDLDLVIVTAGHEERLGFVEVNASNWAIVFLETVDQGAHAIVP
jgi:hypothetical protein